VQNPGVLHGPYCESAFFHNADWQRMRAKVS
jgi:hypothetical protein